MLVWFKSLNVVNASHSTSSRIFRSICKPFGTFHNIKMKHPRQNWNDSMSDVNSNYNAANIIVQRINDVKDMCAAGTIGDFVSEISHDAVVIENSVRMPAAKNTDTSTDNDTQQNMMTGIVVNGFHPQLTTWQMNQSNIQNCLDASNKLNEEKICQAVTSCRSEEYDIINSKAASPSPSLFSSDKNAGDIYTDVFENSNVAQVIATPGGRFGAWNKEFLRVCSFQPAGPYASLTVFDLVESSSLPKLHQIFLRALHEPFQDFMNDEISNDVLYLALTVPCIKLNPSQPYFITLSLMSDHDPDKRCFHCILSTSPTSEIGKIVYVKQGTLLGML